MKGKFKITLWMIALLALFGIMIGYFLLYVAFKGNNHELAKNKREFDIQVESLEKEINKKYSEKKNSFEMNEFIDVIYKEKKIDKNEVKIKILPPEMDKDKKEEKDEISIEIENTKFRMIKIIKIHKNNS
jgi:hypothetical protein